MRGGTELSACSASGPSISFPASTAISIHPPHAGRDFILCIIYGLIQNFNPPAPCGAGPPMTPSGPSYTLFQSTRPMRGGTQYAPKEPPVTEISIHPPHAGRDRHQATSQSQDQYFNPPAPCGAGPPDWNSHNAGAGFQSTRPMRGGTQFGLSTTLHEHHFNPPAPCGAGRLENWFTSAAKGISIHPPHAGRDSSLRGLPPIVMYFNPPAPCGAGLIGDYFIFHDAIFQSTRPMRGGTLAV